MHPQRFAWPLILVVCTTFLGGCGDYTEPPESSLSNDVQFVFTIPKGASQAQIARKNPLYTSPATASVSVNLTAFDGQPQYGPIFYNNSGFGSVETVDQTLNVGASGNGCGPDPKGTGNTLCTIAMALPVGTDTMTISTYDKTNATGNLLSQQIYALKVTSPLTTSAVHFALDANPATATIAVAPGGAATGSQSSGFSMTANGPQAFSVSLTDADGYTLTGSGLPTLSAASASTGVATVAVSGNTLTITPVAVGSSTITVTANPANSQSSGDGLSVESASFTVAVTPAVAPSPTPSVSPTSPASPALIAVTLSSSVGGTGNDHVHLYQYAPGTNTLSSYGSISNLVFTSSSALLDLAQFDSSGNLYIGDSGQNVVSIFAASQLNQAPSAATNAINSNGLVQAPQALAVSSDQLLAVGNFAPPALTEYTTAGQSGNTASYQYQPISASSLPIEAVTFIPGAGSFSADSVAFVTSTLSGSSLYFCNGPASSSACADSGVGGVASPNYAIPALAWSSIVGKLYLANSAYAGNTRYNYLTGSNNLVYYTFSGTIPTEHVLAASLSGYPTALAVSPDGHVAVSACGDYATPSACAVSMWDKNDALVSTWNAVSVPGVKGLSFLSNDDLVVSGSSLRIYDIAGTLLASATLDSGYSTQAMAAH